MASKLVLELKKVISTKFCTIKHAVQHPPITIEVNYVAAALNKGRIRERKKDDIDGAKNNNNRLHITAEIILLI